MKSVFPLSSEMIIWVNKFKIIVCSTDLEEILRQVINKILNVQERKRKYDLIIIGVSAENIHATIGFGRGNVRISCCKRAFE